MKAGALIVTISVALVGVAFSDNMRQSAEPAYQGETLTSWILKLEDVDANSVNFNPPSGATVAVRSIGPAATPYFAKWLTSREDPKPPTIPSRLAVVAGFRILGEQGKASIPELERIASLPQCKWFPDYEICTAAVESLSYVGPDAAPAMVRAAKSLREQGQFDLETTIIEQIGRMRGDGEAAVPSLIAWSSDNAADTRRAAVLSLGEVGRRPDLAIPTLIGALKDSDAWVRLSAVISLGYFKGEAKTAIPDLTRFLNDPDWHMRQAVNLTLGKIGGQTEVPLLIQQLKGDDYAVRISAATALGDIGGHEAFDALMQATNDPVEIVRKEVFVSLKRIDPMWPEHPSKKE